MEALPITKDDLKKDDLCKCGHLEARDHQYNNCICGLCGPWYEECLIDGCKCQKFEMAL